MQNPMMNAVFSSLMTKAGIKIRIGVSSGVSICDTPAIRMNTRSDSLRV